MFALLCGTPKNRLFIARDRFGKKPLFLYGRNGLLFASKRSSRFLAFPGIAARVNEGSLGLLLLSVRSGAAYTFAGIHEAHARLIPGVANR